MKKLLALILFSIFIGCGESIQDGVVIDKDFTPEHQVSVPQFDTKGHFQGYKKRTVDDQWSITIEKYCSDDVKRQRTINVDQSTYNANKIGEWIDLK